MIYVIDHEDSFTYNLVHLLDNFAPTYVSNYFNIDKKKLDSCKIIVFSPGPGDPSHYSETQKIYHQYKGLKKIVGICLGFQQILYAEKGQIIPQKKIYHGFQSNIKVVNNKSLFKKGRIFNVGRYHSLKLKEPFKSNNFEITMRCLNSKVAMSFENNKEKIYGFQFHPESFLTINGNILIKKILSA